MCYTWLLHSLHPQKNKQRSELLLDSNRLRTAHCLPHKTTVTAMCCVVTALSGETLVFSVENFKRTDKAKLINQEIKKKSRFFIVISTCYTRCSILGTFKRD